MKIAISVNIPLEHRTGVEEYIYHLLWNLSTIDGFENHQFFILTPKITNILQEIALGAKSDNREYILKELNWPFVKFWTLFRLSREIKKEKYDILFVPVHTFPILTGKTKLIVTVQGLEFKKFPKMYSFWKRMVLNWVTKRNIRKATKIIVPSQSTKKDLINFYKIDPEMAFLIHHGVGNPKKEDLSFNEFGQYLLYLGRGDQRKNINGLIKAFKILKQKYQIPHQLILAGPNFGYKIPKNLREEIICTGYVSDNRKWRLLKNADVFVFPSFYEGFGIPVLEAQKIGTPVVASSTSSFPEILGDSAILINPYHPHDIADGIHQIIRNQNFSDELVKRGYENVQRFSWPKCAKETLDVILK